MASLAAAIAYVVWDRGNVARQKDLLQKDIQTQRETWDTRFSELRTEAQYIIDRLHEIFRTLRDKLVELQSDPPAPDENYDAGFMTNILDSFAAVFSFITGQECAASLKLFSAPDCTIRTMAMDSRSARTRSTKEREREYSLHGNTAFAKILEEEQAYFFSNDLYAMADAGLYHDENGNWRQLYRSVFAWPLQFWQERTQTYEVFGFLCLDSSAAEAFEEDIDRNVGSCVAEMIYAYFQMVGQLSDQQS